jgi:hypothetical protein
MRYHRPRFLARAPRIAAQSSIIATVALASPVGATWKPEYATQPLDVQQWYRNAELTKAAQIRFPFKKCCDHSDVVKTKLNVNKTSTGDEWYWLDGDRGGAFPTTSSTGRSGRRPSCPRCSSTTARRRASFRATAGFEPAPTLRVIASEATQSRFTCV